MDKEKRDLHIHLDRDVYRFAKLLAVEKDISVKQIIQDALRALSGSIKNQE